MITKTLKTTNGKISISMPEQLNELKLEQLIAMQSAENLSDLQAVSILSGTPLDELQNISSADELQVFNRQVLSIATQIKYLYNSDAIPKAATFTIDGKAVSVPVIKNLSVEPAGAFMAAREIIAEEVARHVKQYGEQEWQQNFNPSLQACAQVLAQYFYCKATGQRYNEYAAAAFEEQVKQLPVTDALPIAKYFFLSYPSLSKPKTGFWHRALRLWKSGQASKVSSLSNISTQ